MSEKPENQQVNVQPTTQPIPLPPKEDKPDPNVKVPAYQRLTEGYDPDKLTPLND